MTNKLKVAFVRACMRENILPMMRLDRSLVPAIDRTIQQIVEGLQLEASPDAIAKQFARQLELAWVPNLFEFFQETHKTTLNRFGFQRLPGENGMVPVLVYGVTQFAVAELVREARRCFDVLNKSDQEGDE